MPASYQTRDWLSSSSALKFLDEFLQEQSDMPADAGGESFEQFEQELHKRMMALEALIAAKHLERYDVDAAEIDVFGETFRRKDSYEKTYAGLAGEFVVKRNIYVPLRGKGKSIVPLDLRAGIVEGTWTPVAARAMARTVASTTPKEAAQIFKEFGGLMPSSSSLDRLPKRLSEMWEVQRECAEEELRTQEQVPAEAVTVSISLDGVLIPMKDKTASEQSRDQTPEGKKTRGPRDYREASCGTVTYYDVEGERLDTIRYARMPESKKTVLKSQLRAELGSILAARPDLNVVALADGAADNWEFLSSLEAEFGVVNFYEVVDLFHTLERVKKALDAFHGEGTPETKIAFHECRTWLRELRNGPDRVLRALRYRRGRSRGAARKTIGEQIRYIENRKKESRLGYKDLLDKRLPVGSGVVEAACKTLVSQRLKCSGMSWRNAQGILSLRSLIQSNRWSRGWKILAASYRTEIEIPRHCKIAA
jgi:hypothetical protein